jgi:hypothetical protein
MDIPYAGWQSNYIVTEPIYTRYIGNKRLMLIFYCKSAERSIVIFSGIIPTTFVGVRNKACGQIRHKIRFTNRKYHLPLHRFNNILLIKLF